MSENAPAMHCEAQQEAQDATPAKTVTCALPSCSKLFTPRRTWQTFCSTKCRNDKHGAERNTELAKKLAFVKAILRHVGDEVGGEIGSDIAAMDPKVVIAVAEKPKA